MQIKNHFLSSSFFFFFFFLSIYLRDRNMHYTHTHTEYLGAEENRTSTNWEERISLHHWAKCPVGMFLVLFGCFCHEL
jgi:hypothetical protein